MLAMIFIWSLVWQLAVNIVLFVATEMLRPKPDIEDAKPSELGEFEFPTASVSRSVPVIFGDVEVTAPNVVWYGDLGIQKVTKTIETGYFSEEEKTLGHRYYVGMHLILGHAGIDEVYEIQADGNDLFPNSTFELTHGDTVEIDEPDIFGGDKEGGGIQGEVHMQDGRDSQSPHPYLQEQLNPSATGGEIPAFRNWTGVIFNGSSKTPYSGGYIGTRERIKRWSFFCKRYPNRLNTNNKTIGRDANPAEIIYEILVNQEWGLGANPKIINKSNFKNAAGTFANEGLGLSFKWQKQMTIKDVIKKVLRHIDASLFPNPVTGELELKLIRDDYDPNNIPLLDESAIETIQNYSREAYNETINELKLQYEDRSRDFDTVKVQAQNIANHDIQGKTNSTTVNFPMVKTRSTANKLVFREMRTLTTPLAKATIEVNREAFDLLPGDVFVLNWDPLGLEQLIMRVQDMDRGDMEDGTIQLSCVEDIFSLTESAYADMPDSEWSSPVDEPQDLTTVNIEQMPYQISVRKTNTQEAAARPWIQAADEQGAFDYDAYYNYSGTSSYQLGGDALDFNGYGELRDPYPKATNYVDNSGDLVIENAVGIGRFSDISSGVIHDQLRNIIQVGNELMAFEKLSQNVDNSWTLKNVWRGLFDTVPQDHSAGEMVMLFPSFSTTDVFFETGTGNVYFKLTPRTPNGTLPVSQASQYSEKMGQRILRPIPPGNLHFPDVSTENDSQDYPRADSEGLNTIRWSHRSRTDQLGDVTQQGDGDVGPEDGVTYTLEIEGDKDGVLRTVTGLTGTSYEYPLSDEKNDSNAGIPQSQLTVRLWSVRDGLESWQKQERTIDMTGYGTDYGDNYGGF